MKSLGESGNASKAKQQTQSPNVTKKTHSSPGTPTTRECLVIVLWSSSACKSHPSLSLSQSSSCSSSSSYSSSKHTHTHCTDDWIEAFTWKHGHKKLHGKKFAGLWPQSVLDNEFWLLIKTPLPTQQALLAQPHVKKIDINKTINFRTWVLIVLVNFWNIFFNSVRDWVRKSVGNCRYSGRM